jgi:hypothetical protein
MKLRRPIAIALLIVGINVVLFAAFIGFLGAPDHSEDESLFALAVAVLGIGLAVVGILLNPPN